MLGSIMAETVQEPAERQASNAPLLYLGKLGASLLAERNPVALGPSDRSWTHNREYGNFWPWEIAGTMAVKRYLISDRIEMFQKRVLIAHVPERLMIGTSWFRGWH